VKFLLIASILLFPGAARAQTPPCFNSTVSEASGMLLTVGTGWIFQVFPGDGMRTGTWLPLDRLSICPLGGAAYRITNTSRRGVAIKALRQF